MVDPAPLRVRDIPFNFQAEDPRNGLIYNVFSATGGWKTGDYFSKLEGRIDLGPFFPIYCLNPPKDDGCPLGICPNPDIDGLLVRIAHYITAFCLTILIFHAPKRVKDAFYYQISTVYALLITCSASLFVGNITRLHATVAIFIASSPVSIYFLVYSIRAFWGEHRLDAVLGKKEYLNRGLVFLATGIWTSIVVYTLLKSTREHFSQGSCEFITAQEELGYEGFLAPQSMALEGVAVLSWPIMIVLARKEIWPPGERYKPKVAIVWKTISRRFPFMFFTSIGIFPMAIWIWTIESTVFDMRVGGSISSSFGQILALFIAVPPFLQVCQLVPQLWSWIVNLPWIACCRRRKRRTEQSAPTEEPESPYRALPQTDLEDSMLPEGPNSRFKRGMQEIQESAIHVLEPSRRHTA